MTVLRDDLTTRAAYVSDASIYRRLPAAVAEPSSVAEIRELLATARENGWSVVPRGGGPGPLGPARQVVHGVGQDAQGMRSGDPLEPGQEHDKLALNDVLREHGVAP